VDWTLRIPMSAKGHEQTSRHVRVMSVIPLKTDIHQRGLHVRLVPQADISKSVLSQAKHSQPASVGNFGEVGTSPH
jgi:hypothetical protein